MKIQIYVNNQPSHSYELSAEESKKETTQRKITAIAALIFVVASGASIFFAIHPAGPVLHAFNIPLINQLKAQFVLSVPLLVTSGAAMGSAIALTVSIVRTRVKNVYLTKKETLEHPVILPVQWQPQPSSLKRRVFEWIQAPRNLVRSFKSFMPQGLPKKGIVQHHPQEVEEFEPIENKPAKNHAIQELENQDNKVSTNTLRAVCEALQKKHSFLFVENFQTSLGNTDLPSCNEGDQLVFVPVVLKGAIDHIVGVIYDVQKNRVELYDPKGLTSKDYGNTLVRNAEQVTLSEALRIVALKYGNHQTTLFENTKKHQFDSHNCGVYVANYIKVLLEGERIEDKNYSYENISDIRQELINLISNNNL